MDNEIPIGPADEPTDLRPGELEMETELAQELESPDAPLEEIELDDGLKLSLPSDQARKLRDGWLRQADYTRKTQDLAEKRKAFDADRETVIKATNEELEAFANLRNLQGQLSQYQQIDWASLHDRNPVQSLKIHMQYQQARDAMSAAQARFDKVRNDRLSAEQQKAAQQLEDGRAILTRDIGWNDELKARLTDHALARGLSREELDDLEAHPAAAMILKDAYEWNLHRAKAQAADRHTQAQQARPAATVSARRAPPTGLDDRLSADEWVRRRNAQLQKRG